MPRCTPTVRTATLFVTLLSTAALALLGCSAAQQNTGSRVDREHDITAVSHDILDIPSRYFVTVDSSTVFGFFSSIKLRSRGPSLAPTSPCTSRT